MWRKRMTEGIDSCNEMYNPEGPLFKEIIPYAQGLTKMPAEKDDPTFKV